jgi:hypothetical protein
MGLEDQASALFWILLTETTSGLSRNATRALNDGLTFKFLRVLFILSRSA